MKWLKGIGDRGWLYSLGIAFNRVIPEKVFRLRYVHVYEITAETIRSTEPNRTIDIEVHRCGDDEIEKALEISGRKPTGSMNREATRSASDDHVAWMARTDAQPVGAVWIAKGVYGEPELGLTYQLRQGQRWLYSARVVSSHRRRGVYACLLRNVIDDVSDHSGEALVRTFAAINPVNLASMAAHRRSGSEGEPVARPHGRCFAIRFCGMAFAWCTGGLVQDRRFTFQADARPIRIEILSDFVA